MFSASSVLSGGRQPSDSSSGPTQQGQRTERRRISRKEMEAKVQEALKKAVELRAWLTTDELAILVNRMPIAVALWRHGHRPRPGYRLTRRQEGRQVWWRVSRERK